MLKRIVVDWGTSNFRAYRFDDRGALTETHQAQAGILTVAPGGFEAVLEREIGGWLDGSAEVFLSGMITSRNGWVETPYVEMPATLDFCVVATDVVEAATVDVVAGSEVEVAAPPAAAPGEPCNLISDSGGEA